MNKNYLAGRRKEYDVVRRLRARGWLAQRSAGSHGLWDVVAVKHGQPVLLVQVKYVPTGIEIASDKNTRALLALVRAEATPVNAELWVYARGTREPFIWIGTSNGWEEA